MEDTGDLFESIGSYLEREAWAMEMKDGLFESISEFLDRDAWAQSFTDGADIAAGGETEGLGAIMLREAGTMSGSLRVADEPLRIVESPAFSDLKDAVFDAIGAAARVRLAECLVESGSSPGMLFMLRNGLEHDSREAAMAALTHAARIYYDMWKTDQRQRGGE